MTKQYCIKRALAALGCCTALMSTVWAQIAPPSGIARNRRHRGKARVHGAKDADQHHRDQRSGTAGPGTVGYDIGRSQVPGVSFKTSGPGQTEFEMRGLTSTGGESPTVGFYLDDAVLTPAGHGAERQDCHRSESFRSEPRRGAARTAGHLYGAGSMGGTIKLVTNQPDPNAFAANVEVIGSGTTGRRRLQSH
jgi:hypothetical protein